MFEQHVRQLRQWFTERDRLTEEQDDTRAEKNSRAADLELIELETDADVARARTVLAAYHAAYDQYAGAVMALYDHNKTAPPEPISAIDGGYPVIYLTRENDVICPDCAHSVADQLTGAAVYYEGPPEYCAESNRAIDSAYGDPDADDDDAADERRRQDPDDDSRAHLAATTEQAIIDVQRAIDGRYSPYETYWRAAQARAQADAARRRALTS